MRYKNIVFVAVSMVVLMGICFLSALCAGCHQGKGWTSEQHDSIFEEMLEDNPQQALLWADSMETAQAESSVRIASYRAKIYNELGQKKTAQEWCEKALTGDELLEENRVLYYEMADLKFSVLTYNDQFEKALEVAHIGFEAACTDLSSKGRQWVAVLLHDIGYSQMQMGLIEDAENSFSQAYIALRQLAMADPSYDNLYTYARVSYNILDAYTSTGQLDKAKAWMISTEQAVREFVASPECDEETKVDYLGGLAIQKALVLVQTGHREEADAIYNEVLASDYAETALGILERAGYLEKAGRYDEISEMMPLIDSVAANWGTTSTFEHLEKYRKN